MANGIPAQQFSEIKEIKEGVLILKNNSLRSVLITSSINLWLKAGEEQEAIIYKFQSFLNSLDFPIEISVHSRVLNITPYLKKLGRIEKKEKNELMKIQISEYRKFIKELVGSGQVLSKTFLVAVPFTIPELKPQEKEKNNKKEEQISITENQFQQAKYQLQQRVSYVASGLSGCGIQAAPLNTSEMIELFWNFHHLEEAETGHCPEIIDELSQK